MKIESLTDNNFAITLNRDDIELVYNSLFEYARKTRFRGEATRAVQITSLVHKHFFETLSSITQEDKSNEE